MHQWRWTHISSRHSSHHELLMSQSLNDFPSTGVNANSFRVVVGGEGRPPSPDSANLQATYCSLHSADQHTAYFLNSEPPPQRGLPRPSLQLKQSHWPPPKAPAPHPAVFLPRDSPLLDRTRYVTLCVHYMTSLLQLKLPGQMWNLVLSPQYHQLQAQCFQVLNRRMTLPGASTRDPTHDKVMRRRPDGQGGSGFQGFRKVAPSAHLKDDICLSEACYIRSLPNFCDKGRRPSPISLQTEST